ncbi:hypothetical protein F444_02214 [Phytophthora nicotianae P1976]|uniref:Uncharacterized protein n=1 Tax=Phytophthora nicotianae P1976 TaxID=1317066 RepID=A0A081AY48_PHYNI|nr:hypothetical protein F444_02214 [Phytophthora nicotianae P1976]
MSIVTRGLYTLVSFESFVEDDGASVSFTDYLCDKNELFGLIDWRKKTAAVRPRWMRASAIAAAFLVTLSLAFLLGTVVYNNESCQSVLKVEYCHVCSCETYCDGARIGCTDGCQCRERNGCSSYSCSGASSEISTNSATETSTYACQSADVKTSSKAYYVTMFLTMVMSKANSIAICSVDVGSSRQKLLHLVTVLIGIALVGFGIIYSNYLSKEDAGDPEASSRRQRAISQTLFTGWWYDQVANLAMTLAQFVVFGICYNTLYSPKVEEVKYAGAAAVHPHKLDANIMKTDDVKGDKGEPVVVEEVKLQPPTQQHQ